MLSAVQSKPMNTASTGQARANALAMPTYCLWVCPIDGVWDAAHIGPYADCYAHAIASDSDGVSITIQPMGFDPNQA